MSDLPIKYGCGVFSAVFGRRTRRSVSTSSLPTDNFPDISTTPSSQKSNSTRLNGSDDASFDISSSPEQSQKQVDQIIARPLPNQKKKATPPLYVQTPQQVKKSEPNGQQHNQIYDQNKKVLTRGTSGILEDLETMIDDHQRSIYAGNMKVFGNLGNLPQPNSNNVDYHPKSVKEQTSLPNGNINRIPRKEVLKPVKRTAFCRALSTRMDPEQLKIMGNEDYKNGRFAEALSLYDAAISIDPEKAAYRSNKSAALTAMGNLLEAVFEAREAIRIEPFYQRAHTRLATLYLRLGDPENTIRHYKQAGSEVEPELLTKAQKLQVHFNRCNEAKKRRDWNTMIKESSVAISSGADFALQIFTLKAEALLKLHRHHEADEVMSNAPKFDEDDCNKFYGPISHANLLLIRAQVDLAAGRIDDAMEASEMASKIDSNNKDVNMMVCRIKVVMGARSKGNELFKAANYPDACIAYGEGLDHDPFNSVLLCNRAACRTKMGQFEKAVEDCTMALNIRPTYSKARLRRADCNFKLGNWHASVEDYDILTREEPGDEGLSQAFREAKEHL
ncbi:TPR repeat-containing thioredoxin TTL4 [Lactuca sativa]|uniref:TPR repeat-containing thioredoxin TTL4 n=1 Tax=Lactuca sativa TaxID=4236 RepID=UPI000CD8A780|nr:TPR repeat-containing thioredoxin TTL4 [Lactuca sativa]